jgi:hypothetical protein
MNKDTKIEVVRTIEKTIYSENDKNKKSSDYLSDGVVCNED